MLAFTNTHKRIIHMQVYGQKNSQLAKFPESSYKDIGYPN